MENKTPAQRCQKCQCFSDRTLHIHHITYDPEKTILLCWPCHDLITAINYRYAKNNFGKLDNPTREKLHSFFIDSDVFILEAILVDKKQIRYEIIKTKSTKEASEKENPEYLQLSEEGKAMIGQPFIKAKRKQGKKYSKSR